MSEIKLVLTDLDGTVAQLGGHVISERVRQAVIACEDRAIRIVPVTARYLGMAQSVLEALGFEDLGVFDNGASIMHAKTGEIVWSQWLEMGVVKQIATLLAPVSRLIDYTPDHNVHVPADNELERINMLAESASHVFAQVMSNKVDEVVERLHEMSGISFFTAPDLEGDPNYMGVQVNHAEANKFHGVEALRQILEISKEHTLAIGDGDNDLPLFENAGLKIAMGNATELLKAQADYIVGSVAQDGFAEAMERFVLS
jgi:HAD superfamily hydrolase (TIGR01484 family)